MVTKLKLFSNLFKEVCRVAQISCDEYERLLDKYDLLIDWTDSEYISLNNIINNNINGVLIFGDSTIEFHELSEEAFNWAEYPINVIQDVLNELKTM